MTNRKEEVQIIIRDTALDVRDNAASIAEFRRNEIKLPSYKKKIDDLKSSAKLIIHYIDELEKLSK